MASVMSATRPGAARNSVSATTGCTCTASRMSSSVTRSSATAAPIGPGARWCSPGIALNAWVRIVAPASNAARAWSYVPTVWPTATVTPAATNRRTASRAPGSSGAIVT